MKKFLLLFALGCRDEYDCDEELTCYPEELVCPEGEILYYRECLWEQVCSGIAMAYGDYHPGHRYNRYYYPTYTAYTWVRSDEVNHIYNCDYESLDCGDAILEMALAQCQ